jgi:hypothetical protein
MDSDPSAAPQSGVAAATASSSPSPLLSPSSSWRVYERLFDASGRQQVHELLTQSAEPWQTIDRLQEDTLALVAPTTASAAVPRGSAHTSSMMAVRFLDMLDCPRSVVYQSLLESAKSALEHQLDKMDPESLLALLKETIHVLTIQQLKSIPVAIIKRLPVVPEQYLHLLAKHGFVGVSVV